MQKSNVEIKESLLWLLVWECIILDEKGKEAIFSSCPSSLEETNFESSP